MFHATKTETFQTRFPRRGHAFAGSSDRFRSDILCRRRAAPRDFLRSAEYIHVVPQLVRAPAQGDARRFGKGLGTGLIEAMGEVPKKTRDGRLRRIQRGLRSVLPQFEKLEWIQDKRGIPHLRAKYKHWRPQGAWQHESSFSDGTLRLIGLLWFLDNAGGPLLLEEPEMSLHPAAVRQLPRILANVVARNGRQVIMTSHSPDLVSDTGVDPSELLILRTPPVSGKLSPPPRSGLRA